MAKTKVTWISDSSARDSVHVNGGGTMEQSYLGHVEHKDADWFFIEKGVEKPHGPYSSHAEVRRAALRILDAEYV